MGIKSNKRSHTKIVEQYLGTAYDVVKKVYDSLHDLETIVHAAENNRGIDGETPVKGVDYTDGYTPVKGLDYRDGATGQFHSFIFINSAESPLIPTGGQYNGETEVIPEHWTDDPESPNTGEYVWMSKAIYAVTSKELDNDSGEYIETWEHTGWTEPVKFSGEEGYTPRYGVDYKDGKSGTYISYVYQNGVNVTLPPTGGSYNGEDEIFPPGWDDDPTTPEDGEHIFISKTKYTHDAVLDIWLQSGWSTPARFSGRPGYTPIPGQDYKDGKAGRFTSFIFKLSADSPSLPLGGSYDGSVEVIPPTWTDDIVTPNKGVYIWISKRVYEVDNDGTWQGSAWSIPKQFSGDDGYTPKYGQDYKDGKDGSFHSWIYKNGTEIPDLPTGGSYNGTIEEIPDTWTDDPVLPLSGQTTYVSKAIYKQQLDGSWDKIGWSTPSKFSGDDGRNAEVTSLVFRNFAGKPPTPTSGSYDDTRVPREVLPTNWSKDTPDPTGNESTWMTQRVYTYDTVQNIWIGSTWSNPVKISGKDGISKTAFPIRIYTRKSTAPGTPTSGSYDFLNKVFVPPQDWSLLIPQGTEQLYASVGIVESDENGGGVDSNIPWSAPEEYQGTSGESGESVYQANVYKRSATSLSVDDTPDNGTGSFNFTTNVLTPPTGWSNVIPEGTDPIYVSQTTFSIIGSTGVDIAGTWTSPVLIARSGDDGSSILPLGTFSTHPANAEVNWLYKNSTDGKTYLYTSEGWTVLLTQPTDGEDGQSIVYKGESSTPPLNPDPNWVYRDTDDNIVYIFTNGEWTPMVYDGIGVTGESVFIRYHSNGVSSPPAKPITAGGLDNGWTEDSTGSTNWMVQKVSKNINEGTWGTPFRLTGLDGSDGKSTFTYPIFRRDAEGDLSTPSGGSYNFSSNTITPPQNWHKEVPPGFDPIYVSYTTVYVEGTTGTVSNPDYTSPVLFVSNGANGDPGIRGSRSFYGVRSSWNNLAASTLVISAESEMVNGDVVTLYDEGIGYSETKQWVGGFRTTTTSEDSWVLIEKVIDGNLVVLGSIKADRIDADDFWGQKIYAKNSITVGSVNQENELTGKGVVISANPAESPITVFNENKDIILQFNNNATAIDSAGAGEGETVLELKGQLGKHTIRSMNAFTPLMLDLITPKVPGATGGVVLTPDSNFPTPLTSGGVTLTSITQSNGNSTPMTIAVSFSDSGNKSENGDMVERYVKPAYRVEVRRGSATGTVVATKDYEGTANYSTNNKSGPYLRSYSSFNIDVVTSIKDTGHGMTDEGGSVTYFVKVIYLSGSQLDPKVTAQSIAQEKQAGEPIGLGSVNIWVAEQQFDSGIRMIGDSSPIVFESSVEQEDFAIKRVGEELHFYEPEESNKVHFKIKDDTGVDATYGYYVNGVRVVGSDRTLYEQGQALSSRYQPKGSYAISSHNHDDMYAKLDGKQVTFSDCTTIGDLVNKLYSFGALRNNHMVFKGVWSYAGNSDIATPYGNLELAGTLVEVTGSTSTYHIRFTRPTTGTGGNLRTLVYNYQGDGYSPGWAKYYSDKDKPTASDVGLGNVPNWSTATFDSRYARVDGTGASGEWNIDITGNAATAGRWTSTRRVTFSNDLTGYFDINGSGNVTASVTVNNDSHTHDSRYYTKTQSDSLYPTKSGGGASGNWNIRAEKLPIRTSNSSSEYRVAWFSGEYVYQQINVTIRPSDGRLSTRSINATGTINASGQVSGSNWRSNSALKYKNIDRRVSNKESLELVCKVGSLGTAIGEFKDKKKGEGKFRWFIADEVHEIVPEVVGLVDGEIDNINYDGMLPDAYAAIAELKRQIDELKKPWYKKLWEKFNG